MSAATSTRLRRTLAMSGLSVAAVVSARALLKPLPQRQRQLVDWNHVTAVARARSRDLRTPAIDAAELAELSQHYDRLAHQVAEWMAEVSGSMPRTYPAFTALDRAGFIDFNIATARRLMTPLESAREALPESRLTVLTRVASDRYIGELFGMLARRVLGQYDPVLSLGDAAEPLPAAALYLIEPNLRGFDASQHIPSTPLRRWIILHELTHAWQFGDHPWLREHLESILGRVVSSSLGAVGGNSRDMVRRMPAMVGDQLRMLLHIQAVMSVLEGYANYLMNETGRAHIPEFERLERAFHRRSQNRPPMERLVFALTGMNLKLRQYQSGERFCSIVVEQSSLETLNAVWMRAENMPSMVELRHPERWLRRIG